MKDMIKEKPLLDMNLYIFKMNDPLGCEKRNMNGLTEFWQQNKLSGIYDRRRNSG